VEGELYYPCLKDWDKGTISRRVGPAMSHAEAVLYLKKHHSGAWQNATAAPQPVSHEYFSHDVPQSETSSATPAAQR